MQQGVPAEGDVATPAPPSGPPVRRYCLRPVAAPASEPRTGDRVIVADATINDGQAVGGDDR